MSQRVRFDQSKNPFHVEMPPQKGGPRVVGVLRLTPEVFSPQAFQAQKVVQPARAKAGIGKNAVEIGSPYTPGLSYGSVTVADFTPARWMILNAGKIVSRAAVRPIWISYAG